MADNLTAIDSIVTTEVFSDNETNLESLLLSIILGSENVKL
ncbi:MAG: hypothetical protein SCK28_10305 [Bacillota bacterium]|nr:hypothetical protein [Bacillota bacterium]